jgi:hypothetical protein
MHHNIEYHQNFCSTFRNMETAKLSLHNPDVQPLGQCRVVAGWDCPELCAYPGKVHILESRYDMHTLFVFTIKIFLKITAVIQFQVYFNVQFSKLMLDLYWSAFFRCNIFLEFSSWRCLVHCPSYTLVVSHFSAFFRFLFSSRCRNCWHAGDIPKFGS